MAMKAKDLSVATSLIIQGALRSNGDAFLKDALAAIRQEVDDWSENLLPQDGGHAIVPEEFSVDLVVAGACVPRTPYNLVSGVLSLLTEAFDLNGEDHVLADLNSRLGVIRERRQEGEDRP